MSEATVVSDRFWHEFKSDVSGTLTAEQRNEIDRALAASVATKSKLGDLRLSFRWFFVRLTWGPEKRSPQRIKQEQELHPVMSRQNAPMLASIFAGYSALVYIGLGLITVLAAYLMK